MAGMAAGMAANGHGGGAPLATMGGTRVHRRWELSPDPLVGRSRSVRGGDDRGGGLVGMRVGVRVARPRVGRRVGPATHDATCLEHLTMHGHDEAAYRPLGME
jgi:hypothetical protein